ncbi:rhoptry neck protein 12, putative [Plasmodium relictum]|uniref:Rhoptry neck protein 12, putative n=1 Tax=Plasmodium relictum TaxID=85471 RepID=A0A1J1H2M8_PLARL|nr:rhoptry neck protein 12, putative [Plasmodium relictum]CRG99030.1 rhoptry neck protein 12, putative [Plasmodium relictum]
MKNFNIFLLVLYYLIVCKFVDNIRLNSSDPNTIEADNGNTKNRNHESAENQRTNTGTDTNKAPGNGDKMKIENITESPNETSKNNVSEKIEKEKLEEYENRKENLDNFVSTTMTPTTEHNDNASLRSIFINQDDFESARNVCEFIVIGNEHYRKFCSIATLIQQIEKLKTTNNALYKEVTNISYEKEDLSESLVKESSKGKIYMEKDNRSPKLSILFMYEKFCVGGIPLACNNILKYDNVFDINRDIGITDDNKNEQKEENKLINDIEKDLGNADDQKTEIEESISDLTDNEGINNLTEY